MTIWNKYVQYKMIPSKVTFNRSSLIDSYTVPVCSYIHHRMGKCTDSYMCCYRSSYEVPIRLDMFLYVPVFFLWHGSAWHASGCQKGAADEPLRGSLNFKP